MAGKCVKDFLIRCMKIDSTTGSEGDFANFLETVLQTDGWTVQKQPVGGDKRFNIIATRKPMSESNVPRLVFNTHLDTVPPFIPPTFDEKNVYGRGCNDAKGQLASMVMAANRLVASHPLVADSVAMLFVVGEEVDHVGMIVANDLPHLRPEYLVVGEPTELKFGSAQKGSFKVHIRCTGKAGHSGYPHTGTSAIHKLTPILNDILNYEWPSDPRNGPTTINIGLLKGGHALNAWAEKAEASIFFRVTTSVSDIRERLETIVASRADLDYSLGGNDPLPLTSPPFEWEQWAVAFNTDLPYYNRRDELKGAFLFGAGSITNAHSADEIVGIDELEKAVNVYERLAVQLLQ